LDEMKFVRLNYGEMSVVPDGKWRDRKSISAGRHRFPFVELFYWAVPDPPLRAREHFARDFVVPRYLARNFDVAAVGAAVVGFVGVVVAERAFAALASAALVDEAHIDEAVAAAPIAVADDGDMVVAE
jgi:hypothetical protein